MRLYTERDLWETTSIASLRHAQAHFSRERVIADCEAALRLALETAPRAYDAELDELGLPPEIRASKAVQPMARVYDGYLKRYHGFKAAGRLEEAQHELRQVLCAFCCWPQETPVLGEVHTLLASLYLAASNYEEAAAEAEVALAHPHVRGRTREVLQGILALCGASQARSAGVGA